MFTPLVGKSQETIEKKRKEEKREKKKQKQI